MAFKLITKFGLIHVKGARYIGVSLQEHEEEGKAPNRYIQLHEFFKNEKGELIARSVKKEKENVRASERVISFTLPFNSTTASTLAEIANNISDYLADTPEPVNSEDNDPF